jgi:hypothetical protein
MIAISCVFMMGCEETMKECPDKSLMNSQLMEIYNDMALENAIISQHTLYPYHFIQNGAELNELGKHDLAVLIKHFTNNAGHLNIRKHEISEDLYGSRVESVCKRLLQAGLDTDRIKITDDMPGGAGMPSESILVILIEKEKPSSSTNRIKF